MLMLIVHSVLQVSDAWTTPAIRDQGWQVLASLELNGESKSMPGMNSRELRRAEAYIIKPSEYGVQLQDGHLAQAHTSALSQFAQQLKLEVRNVAVCLYSAEAVIDGRSLEGNWSLVSSYRLYGVMDCLQAHVHFIPRDWTNLTRLILCGCILDSTCLMSKTRHELEHLELSRCNLDATAISRLACHDWPFLKYLDLSGNSLHAHGVECLVRCKMPVLELLDLGNTALDALGFDFLAQGAWPTLDALSLTHNVIDEVSVANLLRGQWPLLSHLHLSFEYVARDAYSLLGLDNSEEAITCINDQLRNSANKMDDEKKPAWLSSKGVLRVQRSTHEAWPQLTDIVVISAKLTDAYSPLLLYSLAQFVSEELSSR